MATPSDRESQQHDRYETSAKRESRLPTSALRRRGLGAPSSGSYTTIAGSSAAFHPSLARNARSEPSRPTWSVVRPSRLPARACVCVESCAVASAEVSPAPTTAPASVHNRRSPWSMWIILYAELPIGLSPCAPLARDKGKCTPGRSPEREIYGASDHVVRILTESPHGSRVYPSLVAPSLSYVHAYTTLPTCTLQPLARCVPKRVGEMGMEDGAWGRVRGVGDARNLG